MFVCFQTGSRLNSAIWKKIGTQGNQWNFGQTNLPSSVSSYNVVFEGIVGPGYRGDIALDDIQMVQGQCADQGGHT